MIRLATWPLWFVLYPLLSPLIWLGMRQVRTSECYEHAVAMQGFLNSLRAGTTGEQFNDMALMLLIAAAVVAALALVP